MAFETEPTGYTKTMLPDLQGAWQNLRDFEKNSLPNELEQRRMF